MKYLRKLLPLLFFRRVVIFSFFIFATLFTASTVSAAIAVGNYSDTEIKQMEDAWVASGKSLTDFQAAAGAASELGMSAKDFSNQAASDPQYDPVTKLQTLKDAWDSLGYDGNDFASALQAALASGQTTDQFLG